MMHVSRNSYRKVLKNGLVQVEPACEQTGLNLKDLSTNSTQNVAYDLFGFKWSFVTYFSLKTRAMISATPPVLSTTRRGNPLSTALDAVAIVSRSPAMTMNTVGIVASVLTNTK